MRIGMGYDIHRLHPERPLFLGGVLIENAPFGLDGHSDADVLLHALCDALLGAAGQGDIGIQFPNTDPHHRGRRSTEILAETAALITRLTLQIANVDCTLIAERPKIAPHISAMKTTIAGILNLPESAIGIKATTNEGVGFIGRGEGMAAMAVALLAPIQS
jgi:2-C-methyl-D-erythritol 2,4-cyclodiphosphate synthase